MLFHEHKKDSHHEADECRQVIPSEALIVEEDDGENAEYEEGDYLLNDLQLNQREWAAVSDESDSVGWNHQ